MGIRDILRKKDQLGDHGPVQEQAVRDLSGPQFTFIRSDTFGQERIEPPSFPPDYSEHHLSASPDPSSRRSRLSLDVFRSNRSRSASVSSQVSNSGTLTTGDEDKEKKRSRRLSERLHLSRAPESSENVPQNLPEIRVAGGDEAQDKDAAESQWEKRATMLAGQNDLARSRPTTPDGGSQRDDGSGETRTRSRAGSRVTSSKQTDDMIQEAIRLHEAEELGKSTQLFKQLADPNGANNTLSQVLYGLALR